MALDLIVVGVNHRKAPVEVRERLAFAADRIPAALARLRSKHPVAEAVVLSTCNRVELYSVADGVPVSEHDLRAFLAEESGVEPARLAECSYFHTGSEAVRHLFRVACSLDSMVLGETQILGQVRDAYLRAKAAESTGRLCNTLFQRALAVAKKVHTVTRLGQHSVSVSSVAVEFVLKVFQDLGQRTLLILGAGETGQETAARLRERGIGRVVVCNRTMETAEQVAREVGGQAAPLELLEDFLRLSDVVVACASSPKPLISRAAVARAMAARENRPMFLIDIAVPRNVDPETDSIENVYLYNIDDLQEVVLRNLEERRREVPRCEEIVEREVGEYMHAVKLLDLSPAIERVQGQLQALVRAELDRALEGVPGLDADQRQAEATRIAERVAGRMLQQPISVLKEELREDSGFAVLEAFKRLFRVT